MEHVDVISGAKDRRPGLDQLVADARRRRFDAVVVWKLDRLGRSLRHLVLLLMEELQQLGIALVSLGEGLDLSTPAGRLQAGLLLRRPTALPPLVAPVSPLRLECSALADPNAHHENRHDAAGRKPDVPGMRGVEPPRSRQPSRGLAVSASRAYTQAQMSIGTVGAVVASLIVILAAVYIWLVSRDHGD